MGLTIGSRKMIKGCRNVQIRFCKGSTVKYFFVIFIFFAQFFTHAQPVDKFLLKQLENYLNGISSLVAEFTQQTPTTDPVKGKIWLKRSTKDGGKMRLDYEPRIQQRVVARDEQLFVYDLIDTTEPFPQNLSNMPAAFILQNNISLERDTNVEEIVKSPDGRYIALRLSSPADLTLTFSLYQNGNIKDLAGWVLIDPQGQEIIVQLTEINVNDPKLVPESLFTPPFSNYAF
jgi:outer membrane lipoprotein-sorting protein